MDTIKKRDSFLEIYERTFGNISVACKHTNISRQTFYNWKKKHDEFSEKVEEIEEGLMDFAETQLYNAIRNGKTAELIFFLKTKGKGRGYSEQMTILTDEVPSGFDLEEI